MPSLLLAAGQAQGQACRLEHCSELPPSDASGCLHRCRSGGQPSLSQLLCCAQFHVDFTDAFNQALGLKGAHDPKRPLAIWLLVHPDYAEDLRRRCQDRFDRDLRTQLCLPTEDQLLELEAEMGTIQEGPEAGLRVARVIHQFAGGQLYVPPGWPHAVRNLQPCAKIAWDRCARSGTFTLLPVVLSPECSTCTLLPV